MVFRVNSCGYFSVISTVILLNVSMKGVSSLRNMKLCVPGAVRFGETITLTCDYDLESQELYSVKWYRNDEEFYRYVPKESPPSRVFAVEHIRVDISRSNSRKVTLRNVERDTSGEFQCEVSSDAPLFHTVMRQAKLTVAEVPNEEPVLRSDIQNKITPGMKLNSNCTTPASYPSMNLTWYINDEEVVQSGRADVQLQRSIIYFDALPGLETVRSSISIETNPNFFKQNGRINIKCTATLFSLYNVTKEIDLIEDTPLLAPIREQHTTNSENNVSQGFALRQNVALLILKAFVFYHQRIW